MVGCNKCCCDAMGVGFAALNWFVSVGAIDKFRLCKLVERVVYEGIRVGFWIVGVVNCIFVVI